MKNRIIVIIGTALMWAAIIGAQTTSTLTGTLPLQGTFGMFNAKTGKTVIECTKSDNKDGALSGCKLVEGTTVDDVVELVNQRNREYEKQVMMYHDHLETDLHFLEALKRANNQHTLLGFRTILNEGIINWNREVSAVMEKGTLQ